MSKLVGLSGYKPSKDPARRARNRRALARHLLHRRGIEEPSEEQLVVEMERLEARIQGIKRSRGPSDAPPPHLVAELAASAYPALEPAEAVRRLLEDWEAQRGAVSQARD